MTASMVLSTPEELTTAERERAIRLLEEMHERVNESARDLTEAQASFRPAPDRWSVIENVEHLTIVEGLVRNILSRIDQAPSGPDRPVQEFDAMLLVKVPDRTTRYKVPEAGEPAGRWDRVTALEHYRGTCAELIEIVRSAGGLRRHAIPHPVFGPMDGYQWVLAAAAHSDRHHQQILEVKTDPHFPQK